MRKRGRFPVAYFSNVDVFRCHVFSPSTFFISSILKREKHDALHCRCPIFSCPLHSPRSPPTSLLPSSPLLQSTELVTESVAGDEVHNRTEFAATQHLVGQRHLLDHVQATRAKRIDEVDVLRI